MRPHLFWLLGVLAAASASRPEPAGACDLACPGEDRRLALVDVRAADPDDAAVAPDWPIDGEMYSTREGVPWALQLGVTRVTLAPVGGP